MKLNKKFLMATIFGAVAIAGMTGCAGLPRAGALDQCYSKSGLNPNMSAQDKAAIVKSCGESVAMAFGTPEKK